MQLRLPTTSASILLKRLPKRPRTRVGVLRVKGVNRAMSAKLIDGKEVARKIREEIAQEITEKGVQPGLAVIQVGDRKDSSTYVRTKEKACKEVGIVSYTSHLPDTIKEKELVEIVEKYNADEKIHGILVQLPLPDGIDETVVLDAISIDKDVDGFHPMNIGMMALKNRTPLSVSCTPQGCMELLDQYGIDVAGKRAVVIGRSNIVGMPVSLLLQQRDATVTVVHSRTPNGPEITREADIVIAACGKAEMITKEWLKEGCVVIDVGVNSIQDDTVEKGYRLVGDVNFKDALDVASYVTPVPGGVGPMTVAMLLRNTLSSALRYKHRVSST